MLLRMLKDRFCRMRTYRLSGDLAGCRMRGRVLRSYYEGNYEPDVSRTLIRVVQPGWMCVDVGAHLGYFTLLMAKLVNSKGRIVAFEAHPENAKQLGVNVGINSYEGRVRIENMAVSDGAHHWAQLFPGRGRASTEWNIVGYDVEGNPRQPELEVQATSLDAYFPKGEVVNLIKIDIEGAEARAINGMKRLLRESRPLVLVEFHDMIGWEGRKELFTAGYRLHDIRRARWLKREHDTERVYQALAVPNELVESTGL